MSQHHRLHPLSLPILVLQSACHLGTRLQARVARRCGGELTAMMRLQRLGILGPSSRRTLAAARNRAVGRVLVPVYINVPWILGAAMGARLAG